MKRVPLPIKNWQYSVETCAYMSPIRIQIQNNSIWKLLKRVVLHHEVIYPHLPVTQFEANLRLHYVLLRLRATQLSEVSTYKLHSVSGTVITLTSFEDTGL